MPIMLAHLGVRSPTAADFDLIAELVAACDMPEDGMAGSSMRDLASYWQHSSFHMESDAWIIVNSRKRFVGFACVWYRDNEEFATFLCVHPHYRKRGMGTLLLRLVEQRARELMLRARPGPCVRLRCKVNAKHAQARSLFEREGYRSIREFWRVAPILVESSSDGMSHASKFAIDLEVKAGHLVGSAALYDREGVYSVRQYVIYEKELRLADEACDDPNDSAKSLIGSKQMAIVSIYGAGSQLALGERVPVAALRYTSSTTSSRCADL